MKLNISKRFEFSASHRQAVNKWSLHKNLAFFGREAMSAFGHGHNYMAYFGFEGSVDERDGMMINVTIIKERINELLAERYDHKFFNKDTPPFDIQNPTVENLARQLLEDARKLFISGKAHPVFCHLSESPYSEATAYSDGRVERHWHLDFSAARRTYSPHLTDEENKKYFGMAASPSGHGHHYRLRVTIKGEIDPIHGMIFQEKEAIKILKDFHNRYDHKNLSTDIEELQKVPNTTEILAKLFFEQLKKELPVDRIRLRENDHFFIDHTSEGDTHMSLSTDFHAAHRLHSQKMSEEENITIYGKCNNLYGHGHRYKVECTITNPLDERTGTVYELGILNRALSGVTESWNYHHLDNEIAEFRDMGLPSTGENIIRILQLKLQQRLDLPLQRLRLWETDKNRFTLRRQPY